jgi:hypothetical protein
MLSLYWNQQRTAPTICKGVMTQFTVRVELHDAQRSDYDNLHAAMTRHGFSRLITADDGSVYRLPWAEYDGSANLTSTEILGVAQTAANSTGKRNSVLVTEARSRTQSGLSLVRS